MSSTEQVQRDRPGRHTAPPSGPRRPTGRQLAIGAAVLAVVVAAGTVAVVQYTSGGSQSQPSSSSTEKATVISIAGTVVDGQQLTTALHIKADNVKVVNTTVRHKGTVAIRVFSGVSGTVLENTEVWCGGVDMVGVGNGNYTATKVKVHGCAIGFQHFAAAPAVVAESTVDDKPYTASYVFTEQGKKHPTTGAGLVAGPIQAAKAWPGPDNTGVPAGTVLTPYTGKYMITEPDTVIDGKILNDCIEIRAKNVTIKRSKIHCKNEGGMIIRVMDELVPGSSVLIEDSEITGGGEGLGVGFGHYTLRRVNMHDLNEGPRVSDGAVIEDSWIHGLVFTDEKDHQDILQTTGGTGMIVRHNTLEAFDPTRNDPFNAGFQLGSETVPLKDLLVEGNLFTGGNYTVNLRKDTKAQNVVFRGNVFVQNNRYGTAANEDLPGVTWEDSNVYLDGGKPVTHGP